MDRSIGGPPALFWGVLGFSACVSPLHSAPEETNFDKAHLRVTKKILRRDVPRIGMNLTGLTGGTNFATNNLLIAGGFEPMVYRRLIRVESTGSDKKGRWFSWEADGGVSRWSTLGDGFCNGAEVRFFRIVDRSGKSLSWPGNFALKGEGQRVVDLGKARVPKPSSSLPVGGFVASSDKKRVYIDRSISLARGDYAFLFLEKTKVTEEDLDPRIHQYFKGNKFAFRWSKDLIPELVFHEQNLPSELHHPGRTYMRAKLAAKSPQKMYQYIFHPFNDKAGLWYSQLHPGAKYRVTVWLRTPEASATARVVLFNPYRIASQNKNLRWKLTKEWKKYKYDFLAPPYPLSGGHGAVGLEFQGEGEVHIENLELFRADQGPPFSPSPATLQPWLDSVPRGRKPSVRFYPVSHSTSTMDGLLSPHTRNLKYHHNSGSFQADGMMNVPEIMAWALATGDRPKHRSIPLLTFNVKHTPEEWWALVEYLGVPFDLERSRPEDLPYAFLRYQQRGHGRPWTDEFEEIIVEYGNEVWHNGAGGYGWDGFGPPGAVHQGGHEYGIFARYIFGEFIRQKTGWKKYQLGKKIKFALGGNYQAQIGKRSSFGEAAVQRFPGASYLGHANYVGPKWETSDVGSDVFNPEGLQKTLFSMFTAVKPLIDASAKAQQGLRKSKGLKYDLIAYEGGPSGYWTNKDKPEVDEQYGKSLAMGVAALDAWLYASMMGFSHQYYFAFSSGKWWTSHTMPEAGGFRPHAGWLALQLRNKFVEGDNLMEVAWEQEPVADFEETSVPLLAAYAFTGENVLSVAVLSRKYPGEHSGLDFGDGKTELTLELPLSAAPKKVMRYAITHPDGSDADPADSNRLEERLAITSKEVNVGFLQRSGKTFAGTLSIPPGTAVVYVFKTGS